MCGIFALLNNCNIFTREYVHKQFLKGKHRGPEHSVIQEATVNATFGFHRLAINGLNSESNQPIRIKDVTLICNGEIYNYKELYKLMNVTPTTSSDCEVIIHLYRKYGIEHTLQLLDGEFAFCLMDNSNFGGTACMYIARDPYGVRPIYTLSPTKLQKGSVFGFASELKQLSDMCNKLNDEQLTNMDSITTHEYVVKQFLPGTYSQYELPFKRTSFWRPSKLNKMYTRPGFVSCSIEEPYEACMANIQKYLMSAVHKRCCTTDRPIACLLSGGLDSSLVAALVNEYHKKHGLPTLETYSIGLENAEDLKYARIVADYLGTKHTEIIVTEADFLSAIPEVIVDIESYDTTSVRASIGNWLLGKHISANSQAKVIFNGDGSDEVAGGYLYMARAPDALEFDRECRRLINDIYMFDVLRSDKSISSHGLEPRTPFLDREWVQYYLTIPFGMRFHTGVKRPEKYLIRDAFSGTRFSNVDGKPLLPSNVLWRRKEAFSDGVSQHSRSLYTIIQEHAHATLTANNMTELTRISTTNDYLLPGNAEQFLYRSIFEKHYPGHGKLVPYFWMPKYVKATDASARTLALYNKVETANEAETKNAAEPGTVPGTQAGAEPAVPAVPAVLSA
jgi:asparagine synthase (glutamine-hydrolysing)